MTIYSQEVRGRFHKAFELEKANHEGFVRLFEKLYFDGHEPTKKQTEVLLKEQPLNALYYLFFEHQCKNDLFLKSLYDIAFSLDDSIASRLTKIETDIISIGKKTGTDISAIKQDVTDFNQNVLPSVKAIVNLLDELQKENKRREKNGESMIV